MVYIYVHVCRDTHIVLCRQTYVARQVKTLVHDLERRLKQEGIETPRVPRDRATRFAIDHDNRELLLKACARCTCSRPLQPPVFFPYCAWKYHVLYVVLIYNLMFWVLLLEMKFKKRKEGGNYDISDRSCFVARFIRTISCKKVLMKLRLTAGCRDILTTTLSRLDVRIHMMYIIRFSLFS